MTRAAVARAAGEIGQGLAPARAARPIASGERIHVIGAAGAGASAAALLAARTGARVTGCDAGGASPYTRALDAAGVAVAAGHDAAHVTADGRTPLVDRLAVTKALTAVTPDHPELATARSLGLPVESWQQVVADAAASRGARLVAVAGTHGKSTSTGWLVALLTLAGRDPSAFVGALLPASLTGGVAATARWGSGPEFVVEADEYAGNFDPYRPSLGVLLNAEWDHPDVFADEDAVVAAFEAWIRRFDGRAGAPTLVANVGDPGVARLAARLADWPGRLVAVALAGERSEAAPSRRHMGDRAAGVGRAAAGDRAAEGSRVAEADRAAGTDRTVEGDRAAGGDGAAELCRRFRTAAGPARALGGRIVSEDPSGTELEIAGLGAGEDVPGERLDGADLEPREPAPLRVRLSLAGRHNAQNALAVAGAASVLGVPSSAILDALARFEGVARRLELKGEVGGVAVLDDYGHHPTAIAATLAAVRQRYPGRRVWAVYEPLTFHRTAAMLDQFADVLATADEAVVAAIWAGRDPDTSIVSAADLADAVSARRGPQASAPGDVVATADFLARQVRPGDVVLVMGGGHSYRIAEGLVSALRAGAGRGMAPSADRSDGGRP